MSLSVTDLGLLGRTALAEFSAHLSLETMEKPADRLEAKLEQLYATAVAMAQREGTIDGVAKIWEQMVSVCDSMAKALSEVANGVPSESYDKILDIRNICEENREIHS